MVVQYLKKAGICLLIGAALITAGGCSLLQPDKANARSDKVNKRINRKHEKEYQQAREKFLEKHYERQANRVQKRMDYNARQAEQWRQQYLVEEQPAFFERIGQWFGGILDWLDRPDKGLFR